MSLNFDQVIPLLNYVVNLAVDKGICVAVSAGNDDHADSCNISPASAEKAVTVGATQLNSDAITSFTNIGPCVDICAPGI